MADAAEASKRPEDSDFKQQRLPAWQPLLTPKWVITTFVVIGLVFIPLGILIVVASDDVVEYSIRYDDRDCGKNGGDPCNIIVEVDRTMEEPVFVYYELTNFFQNHRRYVKSRSDTQLRGESGGTGSCTPLIENTNRDLPDFGETLYPCGLIANSMFTDSFSDPVLEDEDGENTTITLVKTGIAWQSDIDHKFKYSDRIADRSSLVSSRNVSLPNVTDEAFIVWMRTAGLPTFRKLYAKIETTVPAGTTLIFQATNDYDVESFDGEKRLVVSTTSWLGGKNRFLGWSYIAVAIVCLLLGLLFFIKNYTSPRKLGDMTYFTWAGAGASVQAD